MQALPLRCSEQSKRSALGAIKNLGIHKLTRNCFYPFDHQAAGFPRRSLRAPGSRGANSKGNSSFIIRCPFLDLGEPVDRGNEGDHLAARGFSLLAQLQRHRAAGENRERVIDGDEFHTVFAGNEPVEAL